MSGSGAPNTKSTYLDDGFGNLWDKCRAKECDLEIVRPGKVQCSGYCDTAGWEDGPTHVDDRLLTRSTLLWGQALWSNVYRWARHVLHVLRQSHVARTLKGRERGPYRRVSSMLQRSIVKPNGRCDVGYQDHSGSTWRCVLSLKHGGWHKAHGWSEVSQGQPGYADFEWHPDDHRSFKWT